MEKLTPKQTVLILSSMLIAVLLCVFLSSAFTVPTSSYQPDPEFARRIAQEHGEEATRATEFFLDTVLETEGVFSNNLGCGVNVYEALKRNNERYRIVIAANAHDTPYPFRDVPDVWINVELPDATIVHFWYYAGALNSCDLRAP